MNELLQISELLANLSFFGGFLLTLYGLRRPETRQHLQLTLKNLAFPPKAVTTVQPNEPVKDHGELDG